MEKMRLKIENCRGQCYDGAAVMSGHKSGVATRIKQLNNKALFTHCYGHALNLCVKDACSEVDCLKNSFSIAHEIIKLVKNSPQRETLLKQLRLDSGNKSKSLHAFCPTRWTVRGEVLESIMNNHGDLMDLWERSLEITRESDMKARIIGVRAQMEQFSFFFGCHLGSKLLKQTDNLSATLQNKELSAAEAQELATYVVKVLQADRNEERFDLFWDLTLQKVNKLDVNEPTLPRKRKTPKRYDETSATMHFHGTPKEMYRKMFFESYDYVIKAIQSRFDQPDYCMYIVMQNMILNSIKGVNYTCEMNKNILDDKSFSDMYKDDVDLVQLETQLKIMPSIFNKSDNIHDIICKVREMSAPKKRLISEVVTLLKLIIVAPATNAESERMFSSMKRIKTYLRSTMGENRLNNLMIMREDVTLLEFLLLMICCIRREFVFDTPLLKPNFMKNTFRKKVSYLLSIFLLPI